MGQKVCPIGIRLRITENWRSHWMADKKNFGFYLVEDKHIRDFIKKNYGFAGISRTIIQRTRDTVHATIHCARPGLIIGRKGAEVERLKAALDDLTGHAIEIGVEEIGEPQLDAQLVAEDISQELQRRTAFRRAMARAGEATMDAGALGIRIGLSGRLGGSDMARTEKFRLGSSPLHTLRAMIDYGFTEAHTKYGHIGIKVWINRGLLAPGETIFDQEEKSNASDA